MMNDMKPERERELMVKMAGFMEDKPTRAGAERLKSEIGDSSPQGWWWMRWDEAFGCTWHPNPNKNPLKDSAAAMELVDKIVDILEKNSDCPIKIERHRGIWFIDIHLGELPYHLLTHSKSLKEAIVLAAEKFIDWQNKKS